MNVTRLDERRAGVDFLTEDQIRDVHRRVLDHLDADPVARVEATRAGYESLSGMVTLSQLVGFLTEAAGRSAGLCTQVSMGQVSQTEAAVVALEDTAALALETARTLREQGTGAA